MEFQEYQKKKKKKKIGEKPNFGVDKNPKRVKHDKNITKLRVEKNHVII